ncbi:hypothetical protein Br6_04957 [Rhodococcus sp. Br-6]|nr:hypothetical protein Br6_04957 [Rhodococcus sp. Br-6]
MNKVRGSIESARDAVASARYALRWTIKSRFISAAICFMVAAFLLFVDSGWEGPFHRLDPYFAIAAAICWAAIGLVMAHAGIRNSPAVPTRHEASA